MKLPEQSSGGSFEKCPAGNHLAVCFEVIDLGTQETNFNGEKGEKHQIWIGWETPMETMDDGRPFVIGRRYTLSSDERSTLRKHLESWRGRSFTDEDFGNFDIAAVIGKGCFLNVVHKEKGDRTYANIESVAALPKGTQTPELVNDPVQIDLDESFNVDAFNNLSDRMQETIAASPEYQSLTGKKPQPSVVGGEAEETPF